MKKNYYLYIVSAIFIFFFYLSYNTPLTGDDWTWGTSVGLARLQNYFDSYNGRYLSNILEIILTRSNILRYLVIAAFSTTLIYLTARLFDNKDKIIYLLLALTLLLLMPANMFSQTLGWTAGFVNYVVSLVFLLIYLFLTKNIYESSNIPSYPKWLWLVMIPLGIGTQLVVEHVSIFTIVVGVYVIIFSYVKFRKVFLEHIIYFVSVLIGSVIMFTNKAYTNVIAGNDSYRTIKDSGTEQSTGLLSKIYDAYVGKMHEYIFYDSAIVNLFIGVMIVVLILNHKSKSNNQYKNVIKPVLLFGITGPLLFLLSVKSMLGNNYLGERTNDLNALISLIFFASVLTSIVFLIKDNNTKMRLLLYFSGVVLLTAPFVFITPYGPRAALASYMFLLLIGLELFNYNKDNLKWSTTNIRKLLVCVAVILIIFYSVIFTRIGSVNRDRLDYLQSEVNNGSEKIELIELPHSQFLWMSSTKRQHFLNMFKMYYNVPEEIEVEFIPYYPEK